MIKNTAPAGFDAARTLPPGFMDNFLPLHREFTPRQQQLVRARAQALSAAQRGDGPKHLPASEITRGDWRISLPAWAADQRNQMTGPADDAELVVKMLNSGAPGVMLDLEDSMANFFPNTLRGVSNVLKALSGELTYKKRGQAVAIKPSSTVTFTRVRGLHLSQVGVVYGEPCSASLFDLCMVALQVDAAKLKHPLSFYIPKSESAEEALWWNDLLKAVSKLRGWAPDYIKCMALVEAHPLAYQVEEFVYGLRDHLIGLNLGRWDYMASLIHFNLADPGWVLPDRNTIPSDVAFFQNLRDLLPEICHKRGILAIGGMTALYPSREDPELNARALAALEKDKKNEADSLMDGAWTGHPDQNAIAVKQFPAPNQLSARRPNAERYPDLRPKPKGVGRITVEGTRAAVRTVIGYRHGVLNGRGASLLDGYMDDLATDRIYRLMIAQRVMHGVVAEDGTKHTPQLVTQLFDEELVRLEHDELTRLQRCQTGNDKTWFEARRLSEAMVVAADFDPT
jgi:malate synthase